MLTAPELAEFEALIAKEYGEGHIRAPVHLRSGNEHNLVEFFKTEGIDHDDYVFCTWASHSHALLKGVPENKVFQAIMDGRSITLNFPEHRFYSSAIVGGIGPIATGTAWSIKNRGGTERVIAFIGDMALRNGVVHESICYSIGHDLPITWVIEDNGVSVCTDTAETCGVSTLDLFVSYEDLASGCENCFLDYYRYKNGFPHAGTGKFVSF